MKAGIMRAPRVWTAQIKLDPERGYRIIFLSNQAEVDWMWARSLRAARRKARRVLDARQRKDARERDPWREEVR